MNNLLSRYIHKHRAIAILAGMLLLITSLASLGAGPDEPKASTVTDDWEIFEGHAYADNRAAPSGVALVACLGGCDEGYQTDPVITGKDGIYEVKIDPGQARPVGRMVTFWLIDDTGRVEADQDVLFRGQGETRILDLNFIDLPSAIAPSAIALGADNEAAQSTGTSGSTSSAESTAGIGSDTGSVSPTGTGVDPESATGGVTTDLTVPSANDLGLLPSGSPQVYVNSVAYGGMPLLPGLVIVLGLLLTMIGVSLLIYRRRLAWR